MIPLPAASLGQRRAGFRSANGNSSVAWRLSGCLNRGAAEATGSAQVHTAEIDAWHHREHP